jgi:hypothetical protein
MPATAPSPVARITETADIAAVLVVISLGSPRTKSVT